MARHAESALAIARRLEGSPGVVRVLYPTLDSFPQRELSLRQQACGGGLVTFELEGGVEAARRFVGALRRITAAENLGAVESLITHPATMTHADLGAAERARRGIGDGLLRLSVGLEEPEDLVEDLERGLEAVAASGAQVAR
ncbi:MAG TPA: PLP-dependent transferase, partial [Thermoanaerobaculia bacterium]|nr:PLP-dependent transferase [Thermoanaerobaculia bacterium]